MIDRACCGRACMLCSGAHLQPLPTYPRTHLNQRGVWGEQDHRAALCRSGMLTELSCVSIGGLGPGCGVESVVATFFGEISLQRC